MFQEQELSPVNQTNDKTYPICDKDVHKNKIVVGENKMNKGIMDFHTSKSASEDKKQIVIKKIKDKSPIYGSWYGMMWYGIFRFSIQVPSFIPHGHYIHYWYCITSVITLILSKYVITESTKYFPNH